MSNINSVFIILIGHHLLKIFAKHTVFNALLAYLWISVNLKNISFNIEYVERIQTGLERCDKGGIDIILLDLSLPESQGFDTFFRTRKKIVNIPIIVLTERDNETLGIDTIQQGAQDYLVKR